MPSLLNRWNAGSLLTTIALSACGKTATVAAPEEHKEVPKPEGALATDKTPPPQDKVDLNKALKSKTILDLVMHIEAKALGISACSGDLGMQINLQVDPDDKNFKMITVPKDTIECLLVGNIGIKEIIEGGKPPPVEQLIKTEDKVSRFKVLGTGVYDPPRPFLPAFLRTEPEELRTVKASAKTTVTDWSDAKKPTGTGTISVKSTDYKESLAVPALGRTFKDVYEFEIVQEGFDGVNRVNLLLFKKMTMRVALKPFAMLRFTMETSASDTLAAAGDKVPIASLGDGVPIIGDLKNLIVKAIDVNITADVVSIKNLSDADDDGDDGVTTSKAGEKDKDKD